MNILIVHAGKGFFGGAEEVVYQLNTYLLNNHHNTILVKEKSPKDLWMHTRVWKGWADVINVHNFPATLATFPTRKPIVWMCNEPPELFTNWKRKPIEVFNRWWVRHNNMKVVVADGMQAARFKRIYGTESSIVPYGVDYGFWSKGSNNRKYTAGLKIAQVGHPEFFELGQRVFGAVKKKFPKSELYQLVGKSREEVREAYGKADVLLHPIGSQGGWLVPFEAACANLPVVVSKQFTGAKLIEDKKLGIVSNDYYNALVEGIAGYESIWDDIIKPGRKWVKENLTWEKYGEGMLRVFEETISC